MLRTLLAAVLALTGPSAPATVASVPGQVIGVTQASGSIAWLAWTRHGCRLGIRVAGGAPRVTRVRPCGLVPHDLVLARGAAAWGGYEDVRCSETEATVQTAARLITSIPGDCRGFGASYRGLGTDGTSFYYAVLDTANPTGSTRCGDGGPCSWQLDGSRIVRVDAHGKQSTVKGLPPAALLAGAPGKLALVEAARSASSNGRSFDWPRAETDGKVDLYDTSAGKIVAAFAPRGVVRAVALSSQHAVVVVQSGSAFRLEWFDAGSGAKRGSIGIPAPAAPAALATDGHLAAYTAGNSVRVVDLAGRKATKVIHTPSRPVGLSLAGGRLAWGENASSARGRIVATAAG